MSVTLNGTSGLTFNDATTQNTSAFFGGLGFRNRIINGAMMIDQRNAGASATISNSTDTYYLDRYASYTGTNSNNTIQRSSTAPAGFINSLQITIGTGASPASGTPNYFYQNIEGLNCADLGWGTASASPVTISFWVRSSVTGTFSGALSNNSVNRSYPFTYVISSANTFEYKTVTIAGDTSGTWLTTNGVGIRVWFDLGSGSNFQGTAGAWTGADRRAATGSTQLVATSGATFYITGVQLEKGSTATSFDYRPYGTELALCQRYFETSYDNGTAVGTATGVGRIGCSGTSDGGNNSSIWIQFKQTKRATPTITGFNTITGASGQVTFSRSGSSGSATAQVFGSGLNVSQIYANIGAAWTANEIVCHYTASAEL